MPMKRTREAVLLLGAVIGLAASGGYAWAQSTLPAGRPFAVAQAMRGGGGGGGNSGFSEEERKKREEELRSRREHRRGGGGAQPQPQPQLHRAQPVQPQPHRAQPVQPRPHRAQPVQRVQDNRELEIRRRAQERIRDSRDEEFRRRKERDDARRQAEEEHRRKQADEMRRRAQQDAVRRREDELRRMREEGLRRKRGQDDARRERPEKERPRLRPADRDNGGIRPSRRTGGGAPHLILPQPTVKELEMRRRHRREFARERLKDVARKRREERDAAGRMVIVEPGNRRIVKERGRAFIRHDETERFRGYGRNFRTEKGPRGTHRTVVTRPDGIVIITITDNDGRLLRRIKRYRNGRQVVLIDNRRDRRHRRHRRHRDGGFGFFIDLPAPVINIPRDRYYVDADEASEDDIYEALSAPPVDEIEPDYTLDEIRHSPSIRNRLRRVMSSVNFEFGSWELNEDQITRLENVARAMRAVLRRNQDEMFLIGGHTDAVGSDEDNLSLSDRRAETVARVLTDEFGIPAENLVTQGYGEQYLLVDTQEPEARNRRVEFQRITPALARNGGSDQGGSDGQDDGAQDDPGSDRDGGSQDGDGQYGDGQDGGPDDGARYNDRDR